MTIVARGTHRSTACGTNRRLAVHVNLVDVYCDRYVPIGTYLPTACATNLSAATILRAHICRCAPSETWRVTYCCRGNMAHIRQSRPDSGLGFQEQGTKPFKLMSFRSGARTLYKVTPDILHGVVCTLVILHEVRPDTLRLTASYAPYSLDSGTSSIYGSLKTLTVLKGNWP